MAISRIRTTGEATAGSASSISMTFGATPAVGNFIGAEVEGFNTNIDFGTGGGADNQSNTYVRALSTPRNSASIASAIYFCPNITTASGTFTVTITPTVGSSYMVASAQEYSGVSTSSSPAQTATGQGNDTTATTGATSSGSSVERLVLAAVSVQQDQTSITVEVLSPTWTEEFEEVTNTFQAGEGDSRIATATSYTATWTLVGASSDYAASLATFAGAGGGGAVLAPATLTLLGVQ